jgi:hypothetical protein
MLRELALRIRAWHVLGIAVAVITIVAMMSWAGGR